jgi:hypothetical protein
MQVTVTQHLAKGIKVMGLAPHLHTSLAVCIDRMDTHPPRGFCYPGGGL